MQSLDATHGSSGINNIGGKGWGSKTITVRRWTITGTRLRPITLQKHLPDVSLQVRKGTGQLAARRRQSPAEIDYMRKAGRIVEAMHHCIVDKIRPGMRKCDLVAKSTTQAHAALRVTGGGDCNHRASTAFRADASAPHLTWNDLPIDTGEGTFFEIASLLQALSPPVAYRVFGQNRRRLFLMPRRPRSRHGGRSRGCSTRQYGEDIANSFFAVLRNTELSGTTAPATPISLSLSIRWANACDTRPGDRAGLRPGLTFHFMTGLWLETMGLEIARELVITETGVECLSRCAAQARGQDWDVAMMHAPRLPPFIPTTFIDLNRDGVPARASTTAMVQRRFRMGIPLMLPIYVIPQQRRSDPLAFLTSANHSGEYRGRNNSL